MSFWKKLFGGGGTGASAPAVAKTLEYKGYLIEARPFKDGGQYQLAGRISKDSKEYNFIRADKFSDAESAAEIAIAKGQLIVDQMGDRMFG
jgi:hypothetical protein